MIGENWRGLERIGDEKERIGEYRRILERIGEERRGSEGIREDRRIKGEKKERIEIVLRGSERKMRGSERIGEDQI